MVRVNLLPDRKTARTRGGVSTGVDKSQLWLLVLFGGMLLEIVVLVFVQKFKDDELRAISTENKKVQDDIDRIKRSLSGRAQVQVDLKTCQERDQAIQKLQAARTGPTSALLELTRILTAGRGPTVERDKLEQLRRDKPSAVYNPSWDPKRLWLTAYGENDRTVKLGGLARDGEDLSEFERRLALSEYFYDVRLQQASKTTDQATKEEMLKFDLMLKVRY